MASSTTSSNFEHVVAEEPAQGSSPEEQQTNTGAASPNGAKGRATSSRRRKKQYAVSTKWERDVQEGNGNNDFHKYFCCCARRIGHMFALLSYPDGTPIIIAGPCWPFCVLVTFPLIIGICGIVSYFLVIENGYANLPLWILAVYIPAALLVIVSLFCVSCRDPGLMERVTDEEAGEGGWFWNEQVGSFRPPGALYCRECGVLIQDYDHLCPWTGTGIGKKNLRAFKTFVVSVNILCYLSIGILIWALLEGLAS